MVSFKALPIFSYSLFHRKSLLLEQIDETICESRSFAESMIHTLSAKYACCSPRVSEWLLFNANPAIFQLYHGENKLIFNEMMMRSAFRLDLHSQLDLYSASSLKQQSADRHVTLIGHIILIPSQSVFASTP